VSSPGWERPLRWPEHWRRFVGREARVRADSLPGRHRYRIVSVPDDDHVVLRQEGEADVMLALEEVRDATLVAEAEVFGRRR
jgi:ribosome maturation factor RimP